MYVDSKKFRKDVENIRWSTGEEVLFENLNKFLTKEYNMESFEDDTTPKLKHFKKLKKSLKKIRKLTFN